MIAFCKRLISKASEERQLSDTNGEIADIKERIASAYVRLEWLEERRRRLQGRILMNMDPDQIVRQSGAGA